MKIKLSEIKAATPRVRKELNLDKLDELAESIKETGGVIVPVKLRKNGEKYTTIYGHRRIEACRMAGLDEIEAFIADVDDAELLTQALVENVVREDMSDEDVARAIRQIKLERKWNNIEVGSYLGKTDDAIRRYLRLLSPEFKKAIDKAKTSSTTVSRQHLEQARAGTGDDADAAKILEKAINDGLTTRQTRTVAEEYKRIKTGYGKKAAKKILATPFEKSGLRPFTPTRKIRKTVEVKPAGKILFQWVRDVRVVDAENGLKAVSACISDIALSDEDRGGGKAVLKNLFERTQIVLDQIERVINDYDK